MIFTILAACSAPLAEPPAPTPSKEPAARAVNACPGIGPFVSVGKLESDKIDEASGVVHSRAHDLFWVNNDSGDKPRLFAVGRDGANRGKVDIEGADARDWEDIAWMKGGDRDWLLVGDIGDNRERRTRVQLYRIPEPKPGEETAKAERMDLRYEDGPHNAEVLLVDPRNDEIFVLTKEEDGASQLFRVGPWVSGEVTAKAVASFTFPPGYSAAKATGGDVSDGFLAIRTYTQIHLWTLAADLPTTLGTVPCDVETAPEEQGESVAFVPGGLVTISEGDHPPVHFAPDR